MPLGVAEVAVELAFECGLSSLDHCSGEGVGGTDGGTVWKDWS